MEIFSFGLGVDSAETSADVLGGKGAGLVWMDKQGVKVPPGFIIPTSACAAYLANPKATMVEVASAVKPWMARLEKKFGYRPLVSVRSGARQSMPGMMDTILNVGLDQTTAPAWIERIGEKCVADSRRRLVEMYGSVVKGIERAKFEGLDAPGARQLYMDTVGESFPNADEQLLGSIEAVFKSWNNERAKVYRKMNSIPEEWGTAVTVQAMVFGNMNDKSGTGVLFTRDCNSGENEVLGEFLVNAQGEDVVAGIRTPMKLAEMPKWNAEIAANLLATVEKLETAKKDVQDVEFTIQNGELFILQTRNAKRTSRAAIRIAMDMLDEGMLTAAEALKRVSFKDYLRAQAPALDPKFKEPAAHTGIPACAGIVTGRVVFTAEEAVVEAKKGPVMLVTQETTPDDIAGMAAAVGVLTMTGGATSHAAVVARGMNKACVCGLSIPLHTFTEGTEVSICGATGRVWMKAVPVVAGGKDEHLTKLENVMQSLSGCGIVDEKDADVLDVSDLSVNAAVEAVKSALASRSSVVVDVRPGSNAATKTFEAMFGTSAGEAEKMKAIAGVCGAKAVRFVTNEKKVAGLQVIARAATPEEIVMAEGSYFLDAPVSAKWVKKLVEMKAKIENAKPMRLGEFVEGGYVSRAQLAQALLK